MSATISVNGIDAISMRLVTPMVGPWFADLELTPDVPALPPGPAIIAIAGPAPATLVGFIDPKAQGVFGPLARCRVVGGSNGWQSSVLPQDFHNDAGLLLSTIIAATAAEVLERATVLEDEPIPSGHYMRAAGPASSVLDGLDWHVDYTGTTIVGPRVPVPANPLAALVLDYDATAQRVLIGTDGTIVQPGTVLVDDRFGTLTTGDVEQTWTAAGVRAMAWCGSSSGSRGVSALKRFVRAAAGVEYLKIYRYRIVLQGVDGRVQLQLVTLADGAAPITLPIDVWPGMSGVSAQLSPASEVLVAFEAGDPTRPHVVGFSGQGTPIALTLNATTLVIIGGTAPQPVVRFGTPAAGFLKWATAVEAALAAHAAIDPASSIVAQGVAMQSAKLVTD